MDRDDALMEALAGGDELAFEELLARHEARVWRIAAGVLRDHDEARDVAQRAFLKLLDHAGRYRPQGRFAGWLRTLVTRLCLEQLRRKRPELRAAVEPAGDQDVGDPARRIEEEGARREVRVAVLALPPRQRLAVVLRYDEGCGYDEIAAALGDGATRKMVERLLERARRNLAGLLTGDGEER